MAIKCVTFRVLVKPDSIVEKDAAYAAAKRLGLDLSLETKLNREQAAIDEGVVVSYGPTAFKDFGVDEQVKVGDRIIYAKHAGKAVKDTDGTEYVLINDEDICAIKE